MSKAARDRSPFHKIYRVLNTEYGPQHWWPGDTPFEIMIGAILTQNTAWVNVERAIGNLKRAGPLSPQAIVNIPQAELAKLLRPSGYFNIKAQRLLNFCGWMLEQGGERVLRRWATETLRDRLLAIKGIGPETADDILLYAFDRPVFVIDAYTRRVFSRLGLVDAKASYDQLSQTFATALGDNARIFNQYHALIVRHAKQVCRTKPSCSTCVLNPVCPLSGGCCAGLVSSDSHTAV